MSEVSYPNSPDSGIQRPLSPGDQYIIDALRQVEVGERGDEDTYLIHSDVDDPSAAYPEGLVYGRALEADGTQRTVFVDTRLRGILVTIGIRDPKSRKQVEIHTAFGSSRGAHDIKREAAGLIRLANSVASNNPALAN